MASVRQAPRPGARRSVEALLRQPRYEILPVTGAEAQARHLSQGATVTVTCSPRAGIEPTVALVETLADSGLRLVPHLAARQIRDTAHLRSLVERLDAAGCRDVFVVGGDASEAIGAFGCGLELLQALDELDHPFVDVGVPAYPEGHPHIDHATLERALLAKQPYATYLVTQMCFHSEAIAAWLSAARADGVLLPAYLGVPGVVERGRLLAVALKIGVGDSTRFLAKHRELVGRIVRPGNATPDSLVRGLAQRLPADAGVVGLHLYTFNRVSATAAWAQRRGRATATPSAAAVS